jgi:iron complex outermembrane receptor protein
VPSHSASFWGDYTIQDGPLAGFGFGGGIRYIGAFEGNDQNTIQVPATTLFDAAVHYDIPDRAFPQLKGARLQVNATNIFNRRFIAGCFGTIWCFYGPGRTVLASLRYRW